MFAILGSGFGLYGYLPAAIQSGHDRVLLPSRYQEKFAARHELQVFINNIEWAETEDSLIQSATTLVVSRRPFDQFAHLPTFLGQKQLDSIILEKPIAPDPAAALRMLEAVGRAGKKCTVGFVFRFLPWAISLRNLLLKPTRSDQKTWILKWYFKASYYKDNLHTWKRDPAQGGGVLRFFGIHLIALLAEWGYREALFSEIASAGGNLVNSYWYAAFSGFGLPEIRIEIDSNSNEHLFLIEEMNTKKIHYSSSDIFGTDNDCRLDRRIVYLKQLLIEVADNKESVLERIINATELWATTESRTQFRNSIARS